MARNNFASLPPNAANASNAPNLLCEHFSDRRLVQKEHIRTIFFVYLQYDSQV